MTMRTVGGQQNVIAGKRAAEPNRNRFLALVRVIAREDQVLHLQVSAKLIEQTQLKHLPVQLEVGWVGVGHESLSLSAGIS